MLTLPTLRGVALATALVALAAASWADDPAGVAADAVLARSVQARIQGTIAQVRSTVVTIQVAPLPGLGESGGSGVLIDDAGSVLTCDHVTAGQDTVRVGLADGRTLEGRVVGRDPTGDLALLQIPLEGTPFATFGDSDVLAVGDLVVALGNPFGIAKGDHEPAASLGIVSGLHRFQGGVKVYADAIQFDAPVNPGSSGGPVFDLGGRLIGLSGRISIRGLARHHVGVGFAIPIRQVALALDALRRGETVARGYLGVKFDRHADGLPGARVIDVIPGSPAARAGLTAEDRIVAVGGRPVEHPVRLQNYLTVLPAGTEVALTVSRAGARRQVRVVLSERRGTQ